MKKTKITNKPFIFSSVLACSMLTTNALAADLEYASGQILIKPNPKASAAAVRAVLQSHNASTKSIIGGIGVHVVNVPANAEQAVVNALKHNPNIEFAELDVLHTHDEIIPNDPYYNSSWHLPKINAPLAWESSTGASVVVAVLDTGVDANHPDLGSRLLRGFNTVDNTTNSSDLSGHGTYVAGVIGAISNNGVGVASIAWDTHILPVRVSNQSSGSAYTSDLAEGITWAADNGAHIVNASYALSFTASAKSAAAKRDADGGAGSGPRLAGSI